MSLLRDSSSYEVQLVDAVRGVNKALGGRNLSSTAGRNDVNQFEVQLIEAIKAIGRTISGNGLSVGAGGDADLSGYATLAQYQDLSRRVTKLESESFFRLVDGNVTLKEEYENLWVPGFLAAGGIGSGSGGGAGSLKELSDVYHDSSGVLRASGDPAVDGDSLVFDATNDRWIASPVSGGGGGGGSSVYWGTVSGYTVPLTVDGTQKVLLLDGALTGYALTSAIPTSLSQLAGDTTHRLVTDSQISAWNAKQDAINDLADIRSGAALGMTALQSYTETDPTVPSWAKASTPALYIGTTRVQTSSASQALTGISSVKATSATASMFEWDTTNGAWHFKGNLYADGWVAAGGIGSGSGGGGGSVDLARVWDSLTNAIPDAYYNTKIDIGHIPALTTSNISNIETWISGKLANYLPLSGGTMTGNITMSSASVVPLTDDTCRLGDSSKRFNQGHIRNLYLSYLQFKDGTTGVDRGMFGIGDANASITIYSSPSNSVYSFYAAYGFFHGGNGDVPCGRSDHRWETLYAVDANLSGVVIVNGINSIDQSDSGMSLYNYGGRASKSFNAYGSSINFRACDSDGTTQNIFAVNQTVTLVGKTLRPNYNSSNVNLGAGSNDGGRWATIYGIDGDLSGNLAMARTSTITIGPVTISYDGTNKALHISGTDNNVTIGLYCDGFVAAGGIGQSTS